MSARPTTSTRSAGRPRMMTRSCKSTPRGRSGGLLASSRSRRGRRHEPLAPQPVDDQSDFLFAQGLFRPEGRHTVVVVAVEPRMLWIGHEGDHPLPRPIARQIRAEALTDFSDVVAMVALRAPALVVAP